MAKKTAKKGRGFAIFMVVYAVVFLAAAGFGLYWFWGCMEAYEASRPHIAIDAYMEQVDREYVLERSQAVLEQVDENLQSPEECRELLLTALEGEITYARKASACTETEQVYVVRCGKLVVGSFTIASTEEDKYGFKPWEFREESYDLSALMGTETYTVTAPDGFPVFVNNRQLDETYLVSQHSEPYELLENYYDDYDLPEYVLNTYEFGPLLLAEYEAEIYTPDGEKFVLDESFDPYTLIPQVGEKETKELEAFLNEFLELYVIFAGCANDARETNYNRIIQHVVRDSTLAQRMYAAVEGLEFAQSRGDQIAGIDIHHLVALSEDVYLFDVSYHVDTTGRNGVVRTTTDTHIVIVRSEGKLLVASMAGY